MSTCYVELDIHYENIVNKVEYDLREYEPLFTQTQFRKAPGSGTFKALEEFQVRITKALNGMWKDEEERRIDLNIKDPMTFHIDYKNNIEGTLSTKNIDYERANLEQMRECEPLMCNKMWDPTFKYRFELHMENFYESLAKLTQEPPDMPRRVYMNESQVANFFTVLQSEKVNPQTQNPVLLIIPRMP